MNTLVSVALTDSPQGRPSAERQIFGRPTEGTPGALFSYRLLDSCRWASAPLDPGGFVCRLALPTTGTITRAKGRDKVLIMLLLDTGCRVGEVVTSRVRDVDWERGYLRLQAQRTKSKRFRTVRISGPVLQALGEYVGDHGPDEWLFPGRKDHLTTRAVQIALDRVAERAGLQESTPREKLNRRRITPHILRHTHAVRALEIGVPLNDLQEQLGHVDLATTSVYTKVTPVHVKEVYDKVDFCGAMGLG